MTYREYCAALERARQHPDSFRAGLEENSLRLTTCEAASALGYPMHMTHQITPQRDAFVCTVPKALAGASWAQDAVAEERASLQAWL